MLAALLLQGRTALRNTREEFGESTVHFLGKDMHMIDVNDIIRYEQGEMSEGEMIQMFQAMIDDGTVWDLQGHYGRQARALIEAGTCTIPAR